MKRGLKEWIVMDAGTGICMWYANDVELCHCRASQT